MDQTVSQLTARDLPFATVPAGASGERLPLLFRIDICGRDALPLPSTVLPSPLPQPLSMEAVSGTTKVHGPITTPLHGCGGDVPGAPLHLQSHQSHQAGMLTHTLDAISSVTGEANETVSKPWTGDSPTLEGNPCRRRAAPGDAVPVVSPASAPREEQHEVAAEHRLPGQLFGNSTSACVCSESHQRPQGHSKDTRGGQAVWNVGSKLCSLPPCPAAEGRGWPELAASVHLVKAIEMPTAPYQPLIRVNTGSRPGSEDQHKYREMD